MAKSFEEISKRERPEPDWVIRNLLGRGNTAFMIGPPKKGCKSWMLLDAIWSLSEEKPLWGIKKHGDGSNYVLTPPRALRSVYFSQEDTEDNIQDRILKHTQAGRATNDRLWVVPKNLNINLATTDGLKLVADEVDGVVGQAGAVDLLVFDPMRRIHRGDENDSQTIAKIWESLDWLHKRYNCATLISHHIKKPPQDKSGYDPTDPFGARGSGDIYGGGDAFIVVVPHKGDAKERRLSLFFESKRGEQLEPAEVKVSFETGAVTWMGIGYERTKKVDDPTT